MQENIQNSEKRIMWLDLARGVAMLLIIIGHCAGISDRLKHIIFSFHVPLFFILSGFVYRKKEKSVWKDFKQLMLPYGMVVLVSIIFNVYLNKAVNVEYIKQILRSALYGYGADFYDIRLIGAIWFLPTMFFTRRVMNFLFSIDMAEKYRALWVLGTVILGIKIAAYTWVPMNIDIAFVTVGFMYVGYLLKNKDIRLEKDYLIGCFLIWFSTRNCGELALSGRAYEPWFLLFACAIAGSILTIGICRQLEKIQILNKSISFIGRHTVLLLCIHDLDWRVPFDIWGSFLQQFEGSGYYFIVSVLCRLGFDVVVMCICVLLAEKVKVLIKYKERKCFYGKEQNR